MRIAVIDDYEHAALTSADWTGLDVHVVHEHLPHERLLEHIGDAECLVVMRQRSEITASLISQMPRLRLIVTASNRNASIDLAACAERGIVVCGTRYGPPSAAELTWALILCASRHILESAIGLREGRWVQSVPGRDLGGLTLGLVGYGLLGQKVATYAQAFDMTVLAWSPNLTDERIGSDPVRRATREEVFAESDFISVQLVLSERTARLINAADFARMRPDAWFVNTSRAGLVDADALYDALVRKQIAGAALDVFDKEPLPADDRLLALPNVLATPHIGYVTTETFQTWYRDIVEAIHAYQQGAPIRQL